MKTVSRDKKGQFTDGNPGGGRPKLPDDIKQARQMSLENFLRYVIDVMRLTPERLKEIDRDTLTLGEIAILNAFEKKDYRAIKEFQDRLWGKAKESIDIDLVGDEGIKVTVEYK